MTQESKALTSLILGIVSLPIIFIPCFTILTLPCIIVSLVFGIMSKEDIKSKIGISLSILALIIYILTFIGFVLLPFLNNNGR